MGGGDANTPRAPPPPSWPPAQAWFTMLNDYFFLGNTHQTLNSVLARNTYFKTLRYWLGFPSEEDRWRTETSTARGRVLPIMDYTGRLRPKGVPFSGWRYKTLLSTHPPSPPPPPPGIHGSDPTGIHGSDPTPFWIQKRYWGLGWAELHTGKVKMADVYAFLLWISCLSRSKFSSVRFEWNSL